MNDLVIKSGNVLTSDGMASIDIGVANGVVAELGTDLKGTESIDAQGTWVGPGFVDLHTHVREPGEEWKEDIASASATAAAGGYTAIVAMPNTQPATDAGHLARYVRERGIEVGLVDVLPAGALTLGRKGETMAHIDELWDAGVRMFTDDGDSVADASVLRLVMEYIAERGGVVSQHAVDPALSRAGYMHEGPVSSRLGMYGIPGEADDVVIARDLALAKLTGVRYHVQHLSTARGVDLIRAAKEAGVDVTSEVTAHHLMFTEEDVATTDSNFKMMPPLRSTTDRDALRSGLIDGTIDVVATDHAPHAALEKEVPFEHAPNGVLGLEWAGSVFTTTCTITPEVFFDRLSTAAAGIIGAADQGQPVALGNQANLVVFDPKTEWIPTTTLSKARNGPYFGRGLTGMVRATLFQGAVTHGSAT